MGACKWECGTKRRGCVDKKKGRGTQTGEERAKDGVHAQDLSHVRWVWAYVCVCVCVCVGMGLSGCGRVQVLVWDEQTVGG